MKPKVVYILGGGHRVDDTYARAITPTNMHFPFGFSLKFRYLPQSRLFDYQELRLPHVLRPISDLIAQFRIPGADIYLLQSPRCLGIGVVKKKLLGAKLVMMNGDQFFYNLPRMSKWKAKIFNSLIQNVDGIISYSQLAKDWAERYTQVPNELVYPYAEVEQFIRVEPNLNSHNLFFWEL